MSATPSKLSPLIIKSLKFVLAQNTSPVQILMFLETFGLSIQDMPAISSPTQYSKAACWLYLSVPPKAPQQNSTQKKAWQNIAVNPSYNVDKDGVGIVTTALKHIIKSSHAFIPAKDVEQVLIRLAKSHLEQASNEVFPLWHAQNPQTALTKKLPPSSLKKFARLSPDNEQIYQKSLLAKKTEKNHQEFVAFLQNINRQYISTGFRDIPEEERQKRWGDFVKDHPVFTKELDPSLVKKIKQGLVSVLPYINPVLTFLPSSVIKQLDLPYSWVFSSPLSHHRSALPYMTLDMFAQKEQEKLFSFLVFKKALLGKDDVTDVYYDKLIQEGVSKKLPLRSIQTMPSNNESVHFCGHSTLTQGFANIMYRTKDSKPSITQNLKASRAFLKQIEKSCPMDPYLRGLLKFFYENHGVPYTLSGAVSCPKTPKSHILFTVPSQKYQAFLQKETCEKANKILKKTVKSSLDGKPLAPSQRKM